MDPGDKQVKPPVQERIRTRMEAADAQSGQKLAVVMAVLYFIAILAASFYPFSPIDPARRGGRVVRFWDSIRIESANLERLDPGHLALNFLFYLPLGALAGMALSRRKTGGGRLLQAGGVLALGLATSFTIEYLQIGFNNRDPDLTDTVMNTLGCVAGYGLIRRLSRGGRNRAMLGISVRDRQGLARLLGVAYCLLLMVAGLLRPSIFTEGYGFHGLPDGALSLLPAVWVSPFDPWTPVRILIVAAMALTFIPVGLLFRESHYFWNYKRHLACVLLGLALGSFLEAAHATLPGKACDLARILGAGLGAMAGADLAGWHTRD